MWFIMNTKILSFLVSLFLVIECKLPDYINVCKRHDPNLDDCIIKSINALVPKLRTGIPELHIPPIEPFHIKNTALKSGTGGVSIDALLENILISNASTFEILNLKAHLEKDILELKLRIPQLHSIGNYESDTKILALHIKGSGPFSINITEYILSGTLHGKKIVLNDVEHFQFEKMHFNITIGTAKVRLDNLFNGNHNLGKATNDAINGNIDGFYEILKPFFEDGLEEILTEIANKITLKFEYNELFPY